MHFHMSYIFHTFQQCLWGKRRPRGYTEAFVKRWTSFMALTGGACLTLIRFKITMGQP